MEIIYQDNDIIVVNKPPGVATHGGETVSGDTVADLLLTQFPEIASVGDDPVHRPGIVHRLDKDTSGIMVVARNQRTFEILKELFKTRKVEKTYWAIVCGIPRAAGGIISAPIGRLAANPLKRGIEQAVTYGFVPPLRFQRRANDSSAAGRRSRIRGAREAVTHYRILKKSDIYSLVELKPKTGRMHQLRVHMKSIGHPVACDRIYGGKNVCCPQGSSRQLLHARSLSFSFPEGKRFFFEADAPDDFAFAFTKFSE